jgi:hypothetical protein
VRIKRVDPSPPAVPLPASGSALVGLTRDLDRWGTLFLDVARTRETPAVEQVLGGLVEWMGSDLLDGWLRLPIPRFEEVSGPSGNCSRPARPTSPGSGRRHGPSLPGADGRMRI